MTNSEIWLDETLSNLKGIKSDLWMLHEIMSMPNCNDCKRKDCSYKPKWGEHIRYNCPLHLAEADRKDEPTQNQHIQSVESVGEDRKTEPNSSEKPNNCKPQNYCDDCLYTDTCDSKEFFYACTSKATISKMEQVDKDINVRSKDEPQTERSSE